MVLAVQYIVCTVVGDYCLAHVALSVVLIFYVITA